MAVSFQHDEETNDEEEDINVNDPPLPVNNQPLPFNNEPTLAEIGVQLRHRPSANLLPYIMALALSVFASARLLCWEIISLMALWFVSYQIPIATDDEDQHMNEINPVQESSARNIQNHTLDGVYSRQPHPESSAFSPTIQTPKISTAETKSLTSVRQYEHAIGSSESRGDNPIVTKKPRTSKAQSMTKRNTDALKGNDAEQLQQESTPLKASNHSAVRSSPERSKSPRQRGKGAASTKVYSYSRETTADQVITTTTPGYDNINQPPTFQKPFTSYPNNLPLQNKPTSNDLEHPNINSQTCPMHFVKVPVDSTTRSHVQSLNLQDKEHHYEKPKDPEYASPNKRLETFRGWPPDLPVSKEELVESGLYYEGNEDEVRCFHCGGALTRWEPGDAPDIEHARWYPNCGYIRHYKGQAFVNTIQIINDLSHGRQITLTQVEVAMNRFEAAEPNAFEYDEDPVEHDAAVKSLLNEIRSPNSTLPYSREEIIQAAQILQNQGIALSFDVIMKQLIEEHNTTDGTNGAMDTSGATEIGTKKEPSD